MVTRIPRHEFRADNAAELMAPIIKSTKDVLDHVETSEDDRYDALSATLTLAKWRCLTDPTAGEFPAWESWVTAMQIGCGLFAAGTATEGTVPCRVGSTGEVKHLPATGPQDYLHAGNWLTSFYLAVICRENDRVNQLAQVPISFRRESGAEFDEYIPSSMSARFVPNASEAYALVSTVSRHHFPTGNAEAGLAVLQRNAQEEIEGLEADSTSLGDALGTRPVGDSKRFDQLWHDDQVLAVRPRPGH
ncbi:immunity 49 family protein [Streptomyces sp. SudanB52_2052]|uniref:immunity 49 family protein n=1 Tax=Streptomyces sp. SudanB52_2052 TaxID=3035276 RepID=UPI003F559B53